MNEFDTEKIEGMDTMTGKPKCPTFLRILCILTFIGSGYSALYYLLLPLVKAQLPEMMSLYGNFLQQMGEAQVTQMREMLQFLSEVASWKYFLAAASFAGSVVGAAFMLKMQKKGFHIYVCAQLVSFAILSFLIGGVVKPQIADILWTLVFIFLYFNQLQKVKINHAD